MRRHLERLTDRLPVYHDDEILSTNSTTSPSHSNKTATGDHISNHKETALDHNLVGQPVSGVDGNQLHDLSNNAIAETSSSLQHQTHPSAPSEVVVDMSYGTWSGKPL